MLASLQSGRANLLLFAVGAVLASCAGLTTSPNGPPLELSWAKNVLTIHGEHLPGGAIKIWYLEAYCRPGSSHRS